MPRNGERIEQSLGRLFTQVGWKIFEAVAGDQDDNVVKRHDAISPVLRTFGNFREPAATVFCLTAPSGRPVGIRFLVDGLEIALIVFCRDAKCVTDSSHASRFGSLAIDVLEIISRYGKRTSIVKRPIHLSFQQDADAAHRV
jgi:hypothetical protein